MVGLELTEGQHTITFRYRNSAFRTGLLISLCCALIFAAIIVFNRYQRNRNGKYMAPKSNAAASVARPEVTKAVDAPAKTEAPTDTP